MSWAHPMRSTTPTPCRGVHDALHDRPPRQASTIQTLHDVLHDPFFYATLSRHPPLFSTTPLKSVVECIVERTPRCRGVQNRGEHVVECTCLHVVENIVETNRGAHTKVSWSAKSWRACRGVHMLACRGVHRGIHRGDSQCIQSDHRGASSWVTSWSVIVGNIVECNRG